MVDQVTYVGTSLSKRRLGTGRTKRIGKVCYRMKNEMQVFYIKRNRRFRNIRYFEHVTCYRTWPRRVICKKLIKSQKLLRLLKKKHPDLPRLVKSITKRLLEQNGGPPSNIMFPERYTKMMNEGSQRCHAENSGVNNMTIVGAWENIHPYVSIVEVMSA